MRLQSLPTLSLLLASFSLFVTPSLLHSQSSGDIGNKFADPPSSTTSANSSASISDSSKLKGDAQPASHSAAQSMTVIQVESSLKNLNGVLNYDRGTRQSSG